MFYKDDKGASSEGKMNRFLKKPRSFGWRVAGKTRKKMMESAPRQSLPKNGYAAYRVTADDGPVVRKGDGYLLAPCLVLWATIYGTHEAYDAARAYLPFARNYDFNNS